MAAWVFMTTLHAAFAVLISSQQVSALHIRSVTQNQAQSPALRCGCMRCFKIAFEMENFENNINLVRRGQTLPKYDAPFGKRSLDS